MTPLRSLRAAVLSALALGGCDADASSDPPRPLDPVGTLYALGGFTGRLPGEWVATADVFAYDPDADAWVARAPMPTPRGEHNAVAFDGKIYVVAGRVPPATAVRPMHVYDPAMDAWSTAPALPTARYHAATAVLDSLLCVLGGRVIENGVLRNLDAVEAFAPRSGRWYTFQSLPGTRSGAAAATLGERIVFVGGEAFAPPRVHAITSLFDPEEDAWSSADPPPVPVHGTGAVTVGGVVYVLGGGSAAGVRASAANQAFD
ncbi:MAG: kelch repeat-containing protein [Rubricoccaceae bacterium]|nr:kelch repeat-containing protein [Rubricoccaceae bacterium]